MTNFRKLAKLGWIALLMVNTSCNLQNNSKVDDCNYRIFTTCSEFLEKEKTGDVNKKMLVVTTAHALSNRNLDELICSDPQIAMALNKTQTDVLFINVEDEICQISNLIAKQDLQLVQAYKVCDSNSDTCSEWFFYNQDSKNHLLELLDDKK